MEQLDGIHSLRTLLGAHHVKGGSTPYLLLDAAGLPNGAASLPTTLCDQLECLFTGDLAEELADVAPYLGRLQPIDDDLVPSLGDLLTSQAAMIVLPFRPPNGIEPTFATLHRHFRRFNVVYGPDGKPLFFRYYDPRVIDDLYRAGLTELTGPVFEPFEAVVYRDIVGQWAHVSLAPGGGLSRDAYYR